MSGSGAGSWTRDYFGAAYAEVYGRYLLSPARTRQEAEFARRVLGTDSKRLLDLACGFGRHARLLARHGVVVALDVNRDYLQAARRNLRGRTSGRLMAVRGDMRRLPFASASFDAVMLLFNSFGYFVVPASRQRGTLRHELWKLPRVFYERQLVPQDFGVYRESSSSGNEVLLGDDGQAADAAAHADENMVVLEEIARVLVARGGLLLEVPNPRPLIEAVTSMPRRWLVTSRYEIEEEFSYDRLRRVLSNVTRFRTKRVTEVGEYHLRLYSRRELERGLARAGLATEAIYGSYEGEPYESSSSPCMIFHAVKH